MLLTRDKIIKQVRLRIDEIRESESDLDGVTDETDLDTLADELSLEALKFVKRNASISLLDPDMVVRSNNLNLDENGSGTGAGEFEGFSYAVLKNIVSGKNVGVFTVPSNFLRLVKASNTNWSRSVFNAVYEDSLEWPMLTDKYLTGTPEDPKVGVRTMTTVDHTKDRDKKQIMLFTIERAPENDDAAYFTSAIAYMTEPEWTADGLEVSKNVTEAFYYYLASLVLSTMGDNRSQNARARAFPLMGIEAVQQAQ